MAYMTDLVESMLDNQRNIIIMQGIFDAPESLEESLEEEVKHKAHCDCYDCYEDYTHADTDNQEDWL